jgi:hypothetical protein
LFSLLDPCTLLTYILLLLLKTIEVMMEEKSCEPFVFAVTKVKEEKQLKKDNADLVCCVLLYPPLCHFSYIIIHSSLKTNWTKRVESRKDLNLSDQFAVLSEADELATLLLKGDVAAALNRHHTYVKSIHYTDQSDTYTKT